MVWIGSTSGQQSLDLAHVLAIDPPQLIRSSDEHAILGVEAKMLAGKEEGEGVETRVGGVGRSLVSQVAALSCSMAVIDPWQLRPQET